MNFMNLLYYFLKSLMIKNVFFIPARNSRYTAQHDNTQPSATRRATNWRTGQHIRYCHRRKKIVIIILTHQKTYEVLLIGKVNASPRLVLKRKAEVFKVSETVHYEVLKKKIGTVKT